MHLRIAVKWSQTLCCACIRERVKRCARGGDVKFGSNQRVGIGVERLTTMAGGSQSSLAGTLVACQTVARQRPSRFSNTPVFR